MSNNILKFLVKHKELCCLISDIIYTFQKKNKTKNLELKMYILYISPFFFFFFFLVKTELTTCNVLLLYLM